MILQIFKIAYIIYIYIHIKQMTHRVHGDISLAHRWLLHRYLVYEEYWIMQLL